MLVFVPPHPLINHWLAIARNVQTPPPIFRSTLGELGRLLIYEAARDWLPTFSAEVQGPVGLAKVEMVDPSQPIAVVPVLAQVWCCSRRLTRCFRPPTRTT